MSQASQVVFQVAMRHAYFTDGCLRELAAWPTPATAERLRRAGWLYKPLPDGFVVIGLAPVGAATQAPVGVFPLVFGLVPRDPYFFNYSQLDITPGLMPVCRLVSGATKKGTGRVAVGPALSLRPLRFSQPVAAGAASTATLQTPAGKPWPTLPVPARATAISLDLRQWGSGDYQLQTGTGAAPFPFYADDDLCATQPWAVLEVGAAVLRAPGTTYTLALAARTAHWQYQLLASRPLPAGLKIQTGSAAVTFTRLPAVAGAPPTFLSDQAIALAQRYPLPPYQLLSTGTGHPARGSGQLLLPELPRAGPAAFQQLIIQKQSVPGFNILVSL